MRRQYIALALLLFGKVKEFDALVNKNLWSKNLREDYDTFSKFDELIKFSSKLSTRAYIRRNMQIKYFLQNKYSNLIKKYSTANLDNCPKISQQDYKIWYCWLQGEENLPPVVQCCYNSLKQNVGKYKIVFIDEKKERIFQIL